MLVLPWAALLALAGCLKIRDQLVVMPDGSGKFVVEIENPKKSEAWKFTQDELLAFDPDEMEQKARGIVAMARPQLEEKDGKSRVRLTFYFDDLNAVKFMGDEEKPDAKPRQSFTIRREGDGYVLEIRGNLLADSAPERPTTDPKLQAQRDEMFKTMFEGFDFRQEARLPGKVNAVEGFQKRDARTAIYAVGEKDLQKAADQKKLNDVAMLRATCGPSELSEAEVEEFRKELAKAKAEWAELRKELKKKRR